MRILKVILVFCSVSHFCWAQQYNYYFGNLHSHTGFSDGSKDSLISGVSRPDGAYNYAKQTQYFDFLGVSEHNHYSNNNNPGFLKQSYQLGLNMANQANEDGKFLCLFGMEYGVSSNYNGHVMIYGFNQLIGWETNVGGLIGNNYDIYNAKSDYDGLFKKVKNNPGAFCYLAHPGFSDFTTDGTSSTALAFAPYNSAYDSAIVGMPLRSGLAFSTFENYNDYSVGDYFNYYKKMLYQGYHLGIGYDHDNHYTNFGRSNGGRLVVLAPALTRNHLITAMQQMHFYGSDDSNAKVEFSMNGNVMGSILNGNSYPVFNVIHNDPDGEKADTIKIWRGYANSGGLWAEIVQTNTASNTMTFNDNSILPNIEYYYFAEIKQADNQWIVTSPIWYKAEATLSIHDFGNEVSAQFFPNPASKILSISTTQQGVYHISITDTQGRKVFENNLTGKDATYEISNLKRGLYLLNIKNNDVNISRKLVVE